MEANVDGRRYLIGDRLHPVPISPRWLQRTGKYKCINCENDAFQIEQVNLREENHLLLLNYSAAPLIKNRVTTALKPLSDSEALIDGLGSGKGGTIHVLHKKGKEFFEYSGYLFEKLE
jgi:hypothetical protein